MTSTRTSRKIFRGSCSFPQCPRVLAFQYIAHPSRGRTASFVFRPQQVDACSRQAASTTSIVILGGSSGVGREAAKYLKSEATEVKIASRRTGYDFRNQEDVMKALEGHRRAAFSVGAGREGNSPQSEADIYRAITGALAASSDLELAVVVLRSLILPEVKTQFLESVVTPWVLLRPGPLVDREDINETLSSGAGRVLVTADIRCNGLVSRAAVGMVVGDLLSAKVPLREIKNQVFGVYDLDRMINHPHGTEALGQNLWQ